MPAGNYGARDASYELYDNDANFHAELNSSSADYFRNANDSETYGENRWKTGGGIQVGDVDKPGGLGIFASAGSRDTDGTVDRVRAPPRELLPLLYALRQQGTSERVAALSSRGMAVHTTARGSLTSQVERKPVRITLVTAASAYNIDLEGAFVAAGGTSYGTIPATKFGSCLVVTFHRMGLRESDVTALARAYGCGDQAPSGSARSKIAPHEYCAWKDLCEDVGEAADVFARNAPLPDAASRVFPHGVRY